MLKLGITGGIGSGKSTISKLLKLLGIPVYMADAESKILTATSPIIKEKLIKELGKELYNGNELNKVLLASYIFNDAAKLQTVNAIIHPEVRDHYLKWLEKHHSYPVVAHEAAILFESGLNKLVDKTVTVYTPLDMRIERVMQRDRTTREKVIERINSQMPEEEKIKLSDYVIYNDGSESLIRQTLDILKELNYEI